MNLLAESRRRHGSAERIEQGGTVKQLAKGAQEQLLGARQKQSGGDAAKKTTISEDDEKLKAAMGRRKDH